MPVHVGILGGGGISNTHALAASQIDGVEVVAVGGDNALKVTAIAERHGASAYTDVEALMRHRPMEVLLIGTPSALHADHGIAAARAGLHVLVEKPLDITTERADAVISACAEASVTLGVFFQDRCAPDLVRLKAAIDEGALGRPLLGSARVKWWRPAEVLLRVALARPGGPRRWRRRDEPGHPHRGPSPLVVGRCDACLRAAGDRPSPDRRRRHARGRARVRERRARDVRGHHRGLSGLSAADRVERHRGHVIVQHDRLVSADLRTPRPNLRGGEAANENAAASSAIVSDVRGHQAVIEDFLRAIRDGSEPRCSGAEGRRSVVVVEALYRSARTGHARGDQPRLSATAPSVDTTRLLQ